MIPNIIVITFRTLSPELDEALANDDLGQILTHLFATGIGIILAFRYSRVRDHEYRRSKAIDALSRTYKLEDKGLWEKGEVAIQRLEARAHFDFKGRKASRSRMKMQGSIGQFNRESEELEHNEDDSEYSVSVDGIEIIKEKREEQKLPEKFFFRLIANFFSSLVDKSANKRAEKNKQEVKKKQLITKDRVDDFQSFSSAGGSQWVIPDGTQRKTRFCNSCSTYNDAVSDYCTSCGSFMS
tara:strand:- start:114 stop:833 length:720 start_codon:yes stop_codon:yes gene_type:complete